MHQTFVCALIISAIVIQLNSNAMENVSHAKQSACYEKCTTRQKIINTKLITLISTTRKCVLVHIS